MKITVLSCSIPLICCFPFATVAQIVPDATLPTNSIVTPTGNSNIITGGTSSGSNLFHSFSEFSIPTNSEALFNNPSHIQNIFTRVTGNSISNIDGTIKANGTANLFLLNPNGIIFGPNAQLNIGGSFLATSASSISFADKTEFNTTNPTASSLLTVSIPIGLQFGRENPGAIEVQGSNLAVQTGNTLALLGGNVTISGNNNPQGTGLTAGGIPFVTVQGNLVPTTPGGRIELASVNRGNVSISKTDRGFSYGYADVREFGDIQMLGRANIDTSGTSGGEIQLTARNLRLREDFRILSATYGSLAGEDIILQSSESVELIGSGNFIENFQRLADSNVSPLEFRNVLFNTTVGSGKAGDIVIDTGRFIARDGSFVLNSTIGSGDGGNLILNARNSVEVNSAGLITATRARSIGDAGNLTINTQNLLLQDRGIVTTSTTGFGNGGTLTVNASESVELIGGDTYRVLGVRSNTVLTTASIGAGDTGDLIVNTRRLTMRDGGAITANTISSRRSATLYINASELVEAIGKSPNADLFPSGVYSNTLGSGNAGNIRIFTSMLLVRDEARVGLDSFSTGNAGNLEISADSMRLENRATLSGTTRSRSGGNITLNVGSLQLRGGSAITTNASNSANGGNITLNLDTLTILENSKITANAVRGSGGNIELDAKGIFRFADSAITASSDFGINGTVEVRTPDSNVHSALVPLSSNFAVADNVLANACINPDVAGNSFSVIGTGGLPNTPYEALSAWYSVAGVQATGKTEDLSIAQPPESSISDRIVEAQGIAIASDGRLMLVTQTFSGAIADAKDMICKPN